MFRINFAAHTYALLEEFPVKKIKLMLTTFSIVLALSGIFAPVQVRADSGDPQGENDSKSRQVSSSQQQQQAALALLAWLMHLLGW